jgi:hypothetical protein
MLAYVASPVEMPGQRSRFFGSWAPNLANDIRLVPILSAYNTSGTDEGVLSPPPAGVALLVLLH